MGALYADPETSETIDLKWDNAGGFTLMKTVTQVEA